MDTASGAPFKNEGWQHPVERECASPGKPTATEVPGVCAAGIRA